ncbi:multiple cyclophane-containing RiPP AmcA [Streptomyces roseifaciens]|uniref:multiple cyclophane-containing RiPP AmcA n=1 Tax=Streptomyces roseifaciens TaxID=1488406 RepID=UPI00099F98AE
MPTPTATDRVRASKDALQTLMALSPTAPGGGFDNRPTWDNITPQFDNRTTWDNWNKKTK